MTFIHGDCKEGAVADVWAYARVGSPAETVRAALPELAGANGARLIVWRDGEPAGPPAGAVRFEARWHTGRSSGEADVLVFPVSSGLCEVHVGLRSPKGLGWPTRKLASLASDLARALADAAERTGDTRRAHPAPQVARGRWVFVS